MKCRICDACRSLLKPTDDDLYEIRINARLMNEPCALTDADLDDTEELGAILRAAEAADREPPMPPPAQRRLRYDLCRSCYKKYLRNPLGIGVGAALEFSKN